MASTCGTVLVVDDDQDMRWAIRTILAETGITVAEAGAGALALETVSRCVPDAVVLDMRMPGVSGDEVLRCLRRQHRDLPVIVVTAFGTIPGAVDAIKMGACEYITKPFRNERLLGAVRRAISRRRVSATVAAPFTAPVAAPAATSGVRGAITSIMGHSPPIQSLVDQIDAVIATDYSVLIRGETGAGKEVVARCLHEHGAAARRPLVVIDCGSVVDSLADSAFFGHEKGAYTGATSRHRGWFEAAADGGTIFLDEIGNLSLAGQKALLRAIEEHVIYRVGSTAPIRVDVRIVAATNDALEDHIKAGSFREDLFFRLAEYVIDVPPLRDRREDVEFLAYRFLDEACAALRRPKIGIATIALDLLRSYDWPGNVRELRNVVRRAALLATDTITAGQIAGHLGGRSAAVSTEPNKEIAAAPLRRHVRDKVREVERNAVFEALDRAGGNKTEAARLLGIDYKTYRTKLKALTDHSVG